MPLAALYRERPADFIILLEMMCSPRTQEAGAVLCKTRALQPGARSLGDCSDGPSPSMYGHYYNRFNGFVQAPFWAVFEYESEK